MWRGVVAFGRLRLLADAGSVGGNWTIGKTRGRAVLAARRRGSPTPLLGGPRYNRQPLDLQPLHDLVAAAE